MTLPAQSKMGKRKTIADSDEEEAVAAGSGSTSEEEKPAKTKAKAKAKVRTQHRASTALLNAQVDAREP